MKQIDEARLESDLGYRFDYISTFMNFGSDDIKCITDAAPILAPLVGGLVDAVYDKLYQQDCTWRHFYPRQDGYDGDLPENLEALTPDHPQIKFRKEHLSNYLVKLVSGPYDEKLVGYLDGVGKMHTAGQGSSKIQVPLVQMNALMGFVSDALTATLLGQDLTDDVKHATVRAFNKLLWIQNDLINRHYQK